MTSTLDVARRASATSFVRVRGTHPADARIVWPDASRGIAIVLVVVGHAAGGLIASGYGETSPWLPVLFRLIYSFHMSLFFILSGLFMQGRIRRGPEQLIRHSLVTLAWPYVLWGSLQFIVITQLGHLVNAPYTLSAWAIVGFLWSPPSQFWFLYVLFVLQVATVLLLPRVGASAILALFLLGFGAAALAQPPGVLGTIMRSAPFFGVGAALGPQLLDRVGRLRHSFVLAGGAGVAWLLLVILLPDSGGGLPVAVLGLVVALAGSGAIIALVAAPALPGRSLLAELGRRSMPIFLLHVLFVAGARIVLKTIGVVSIEIVAPLIVLCGLVGPLVADALARRFEVARLLGFG